MLTAAVRLTRTTTSPISGWRGCIGCAARSGARSDPQSAHTNAATSLRNRPRWPIWARLSRGFTHAAIALRAGGAGSEARGRCARWWACWPRSASFRAIELARRLARIEGATGSDQPSCASRWQSPRAPRARRTPASHQALRRMRAAARPVAGRAGGGARPRQGRARRRAPGGAGSARRPAGVPTAEAPTPRSGARVSSRPACAAAADAARRPRSPPGPGPQPGRPRRRASYAGRARRPAGIPTTWGRLPPRRSCSPGATPGRQDPPRADRGARRRQDRCGPGVAARRVPPSRLR